MTSAWGRRLLRHKYGRHWERCKCLCLQNCTSILPQDNHVCQWHRQVVAWLTSATISSHLTQNGTAWHHTSTKTLGDLKITHSDIFTHLHRNRRRECIDHKRLGFPSSWSRLYKKQTREKSSLYDIGVLWALLMYHVASQHISFFINKYWTTNQSILVSFYIFELIQVQEKHVTRFCVLRLFARLLLQEINDWLAPSKCCIIRRSLFLCHILDHNSINSCPFFEEFEAVARLWMHHKPFCCHLRLFSMWLLQIPFSSHTSISMRHPETIFATYQITMQSILVCFENFKLIQGQKPIS